MNAQAAERTNVVTANFTDKTPTLKPSELIFDWEDGLLNTPSYVFLALKFDGIGRNNTEDFDLTDFIDRWEGNKDAKGKSRRLKPQDVTSVIRKMEKAGRAKIEMQMSLKLEF